MEKNPALRKITAAAMVAWLITFIFLCVYQAAKLPSDPLKTYGSLRTATLLRDGGLPLSLQKDPGLETRNAATRKRSGTGVMRHVDRPGATTVEYGELYRSAGGHTPVPNDSHRTAGVISIEEGPRGGERPAMRVQAYTTEELDSLIELGTSFKNQGNRTEAFSAFRRALSLDGKNVTALTGMGDLFRHAGLLDSAVALYTAAAAVNPNVARLQDGLGSVRYYFSRLVANPNFARRNNIADPERYIKAQYDGALAAYTEAVRIDSTYVQALTNRGVVRYNHDDREGAIDDYTLAIKINPSYADAYRKRATAHKDSKRHHDALADFTNAIRLDSGSYEFNPTLNFANAYFGRAGVFFRLRKFKEAVADYDRVLALVPHHRLAVLNRAIALYRLKQYEDALAGLNAAIETLSPSEYNEAQRYGYLYRGHIFKTLGEYDNAIDDYSAALETPRISAHASWLIAACHSRKGDTSRAIAWLKKSISFGFTDFNLWKNNRDFAAILDTEEFKNLVLVVF